MRQLLLTLDCYLALNYRNYLFQVAVQLPNLRLQVIQVILRRLPPFLLLGCLFLVPFLIIRIIVKLIAKLTIGVSRYIISLGVPKSQASLIFLAVDHLPAACFVATRGTHRPLRMQHTPPQRHRPAPRILILRVSSIPVSRGILVPVLLLLLTLFILFRLEISNVTILCARFNRFRHEFTTRDLGNCSFFDLFVVLRKLLYRLLICFTSLKNADLSVPLLLRLSVDFLFDFFESNGILLGLGELRRRSFLLPLLLLLLLPLFPLHLLTPITHILSFRQTQFQCRGRNSFF